MTNILTINPMNLLDCWDPILLALDALSRDCIFTLRNLLFFYCCPPKAI